LSEIYSHSRLSTFEDCPKRFEYRYVLKIPSETEGIEAFVGKRVHDILERLYIAAGKGQVPSLEKVIYRYEQLFEEHYDAGRVRIAREGTPVEFYRRYGEHCLRDFYRRHYPFDGDETLGLEHRVLFSLDDEGEYRLQGIIDRVTRAPDGAIEIQDYKTGKRLPTQADLDEDRQLALYQIGLMDRYPGQPIRLVWHFLKHNRLLKSTRTAKQLDVLRDKTIDVIDRIRAETEFKPKRSGLCDWCEYNDRCPIYPKKRDHSDDRVAALSDPFPGSKSQLELLSRLGNPRAND
jgi:putative RecB family exonuclease